jgi:outer membrane protein assembly factor BamB
MQEKKLLHKLRETGEKLVVMMDRLRTGTPKYEWPHVRGANQDGFNDVSGGKGSYLVLFLSEDQHLYAFNLKGQQLWSTKIEGGVEVHYRNVYNTPAVIDSTIYITGKEGMLYALDFSGQVKWEKKIEKSYYDNPSSPVIKEDMIAFGQNNNAFLIDLNGNLIWKVEEKGSCHAPPVLLDDLILFQKGFSPDSLIALDYNGNEKWHFEARINLNHSPVVDDGIIYISTVNDGLYALDMQGKKMWNFKVPDVPDADLSAPVIKGDRIIFNYQGHNNSGTIAIDKTREIIWTKRLYRFGSFHSTFPPTLYKDKILIPSYTKIFACDWDGNLLWGDYVAGGTVSSLSVIDGFAVFTNGYGRIKAIEPDTVIPVSSITKNPLYLLIYYIMNKSLRMPKELWQFDQYGKTTYHQTMPIIVRVSKE